MEGGESLDEEDVDDGRRRGRRGLGRGRGGGAEEEVKREKKKVLFFFPRQT